MKDTGEAFRLKVVARLMFGRLLCVLHEYGTSFTSTKACLLFVVLYWLSHTSGGAIEMSGFSMSYTVAICCTG